MFSKKNIEKNTSTQMQQQRILTKVIGQEISLEELKQISGGDGSGTNVYGQGNLYIDKVNRA